jgi:hypothetical protein
MPATTSAARRLLALSVLARLPLAMLSIGWLVHVEGLTHSFATAGLVAGALAIAQGIGGPLLGRVADRRGQTAVLAGSALVAGAALVFGAALPAGTPAPALVAVAALLGLATPPVGACMRALLPGLIADAEQLRRAYTIDATAVELTWAAGPPLVLLGGAVASTGTALVAAGILLAGATLAFAAAPASRAWRPAAEVERPAGGALRAPGMRTLVVVLAGVGVLFGSVEVATASAAGALGVTAAAGPLLGLWGLGSLLGGIAATRAGGVAGTGAGLVLLLGGLGAAHVALVAATGSLVALGALTLLAGVLIAPTLATPLSMVDALAPDGTRTEAFAWLATAIAIGTSLGAAGAGAVAEAAGPAATFALAGGAGLAAAAVALLRTGSLPGGGPCAAPAAA